MTPDAIDAGPHEAWHSSPAHQHLVQFYESEDYLLEMLSRFVATTLQTNEAGIVVATGSHVERLNHVLREEGIDIVSASDRGQLITLDAREMMRRFMVQGAPNPEKFRELFSTIVSEVRENWASVRVFGEMVALIDGQDSEIATIQLEQLWNDLLSEHEFSLCCAYPLRTFTNDASDQMLRSVCEQHSAVFPAESYSTLNTDEDRFREIALLQQKAAQLEIEVQQRALAQKRLSEALDAERAARREAEHALRVRDEFVSIAAHELKTPLTSLIGRAQLAVKRMGNSGGNEPEQIEHLVESIVGQAEKLSHLISQLLDVSRLKAGKLLIDRQPVDLVPLVHDAVSSVRTGSERHVIRVSAPETIQADVDPVRLEQVIVNLLNNAVKFSPPGSEVQVSLTRPECNVIELIVEDQGPGVPLAERDRIFDQFYQGGNQTVPGGMGLGLFICREIVELHDGDVLAEFPEYGGTRFIVRLPASPS